MAALWAGAKADKNVLIKTKCLVVCKCVRLKNNNFFNIFSSIGEKMASPTTVYRGSFFMQTCVKTCVTVGLSIESKQQAKLPVIIL